MKVLQPAAGRGNNVGRLGHGLGLQLTEPPSNKAGDSSVLLPGMVITIEPSKRSGKPLAIATSVTPVLRCWSPVTTPA